MFEGRDQGRSVPPGRRDVCANGERKWRGSPMTMVEVEKEVATVVEMEKKLFGGKKGI